MSGSGFMAVAVVVVVVVAAAAGVAVSVAVVVTWAVLCPVAAVLVRLLVLLSVPSSVSSGTC